MHTPFPVIGDGLSWLAFWGSYLGGVITVFATILILLKNHNNDYRKKEYELQEKYFNEICISMAELCTTINIDQFTCLLLDLNNKSDRVQNINRIGEAVNTIKGTYNKFALRYAHNGGKAKEDLLGYYQHIARKIEMAEETILTAHVDLSTNKISQENFNAQINLTLRDLKALEDVTTQIFLLASVWKRQEWDILEQKRKLFLNS